MALKATLEKGKLTLVIDTTTPDLKSLPKSSSGKTLLVATTSGNLTTEVKVNGKPLIIGLNAYIRGD